MSLQKHYDDNHRREKAFPMFDITSTRKNGREDMK